MSLGYVQKGQTIHVGFGANENHIFDSFETDFHIVRSLPRAAPDLSGLDHDGLVVSANESRGDVPGAIPNDNENDREAIAAALEFAKVSGASEVTLEPGIYNLTTDGLSDEVGTFFSLVRYNDLVINGNGSTLIVDDYTRAVFNLHGATNVIFKDLTIDFAERVPAQGLETNDLYRPLTFTQGYVSNLNKLTNSFTLTVNTDAFLAPDSSFETGGEGLGFGYAVDRFVDGRLKVGTDWHYSTREVSPGASPDQFTIRVPHTFGLADGDRYVLQRRVNLPIFGVYNASENVSVIGVTAYSGPSVFVSSQQSNNTNVIDSHVAIKADEWTRTANTKRWKSINGDGVHVQSNRSGVWVEGSSFEGLGDDVMNFYTLPLTVYERLSPTEFTLGQVVINSIKGVTDELMQVGDRLTFFDPIAGRIMKDVKVTAVRDRMIPDFSDPTREIRLKTVTIDQSVEGVIVGDPNDAAVYRDETTVFNNSVSRSSLVQDTYISNSRRYGNFLMSDNVHLIDNVYEGLSDEAIAGHNEPGWPLGLFANDILVQGNEFSNNGFSSRYLYDDFHTGTVAFHAGRYVSPNAEGNIGRHLDHLVDEHEYAYRNLQIRDNVFTTGENQRSRSATLST